MTLHLHLPHPAESLRTLLLVAATLALLLVLFCASPIHSQTASADSGQVPELTSLHD
jgi:hypothetical protein